MFSSVCSTLYQEPAFYDMWGLLKKEGVLQGRLINHVWSRFQPEERLRLLEIMEEFDLVCVAPKDAAKRLQVDGAASKGQEETPGRESIPLFGRNYYVPSLFNPGNVKEDSDLDESSSMTFFVDFSGLFTSK